MTGTKEQDLADLWKRVGLDTLRKGLIEVYGLAQEFESALTHLPSCDQCARVALVDEIKKTGSDLGGKVIGLTALAETLRTALTAAEKAGSELEESCPLPCQCPKGECTCHS